MALDDVIGSPNPILYAIFFSSIHLLNAYYVWDARYCVFNGYLLKALHSQGICSNI